ncbi:MAG: hypothetical protein H0V39_04525 [Nitrosomonas sp.]|nr:hypothetical protein [Nitrosomonas sp.]
MLPIFSKIAILMIAFMLIGCVNVPTGPSVMALPGTGVSFDQFRFDEQECKQYAYEQVGGKTPNESSMFSGAQSAAIGSALGAIAGVAIGGGRGAAIGAGTGLLGGGLVGSGSASDSGAISQQRYDNSYIQCMYAKGHRVPVAGQITDSAPKYKDSSKTTSEPPSGYIPPPPPGSPPPAPY